MYKEIVINGKKINYRKWKVKDKKNFDNAVSVIDKRKIMVYDCLENPIPLDIEEYNYLLCLIRDYSLNEDIHYSVECYNCDTLNEVNLQIQDIVSFKEMELTPIIIDKTVIDLQHIKDINSYEETMTNSLSNLEKYIADLSFHIKSINSSDVSQTEVLDYIYNLDIDIFNKLIKEWDKRKNKCIYKDKFICPNCGKEIEFNFENIPNFFPESWKL